MLTILGKKVGMTQVFSEDGEMIPVTVVEAGPATVTQVKTTETDGYNAVQIGFENLKENRAIKPQKGHFDKWNSPLKKHVTEIRLDEGESYDNGQIITVEYFEEGTLLDVTGISKGKGTQGNIKRHGHHRGPMTHGSKHKRMVGALAAGTYPSRVFKGNAGPGRMGRDTITVQNVELIKVIPERHIMLIKGALPGKKGGLLKIQYAVKDADAIERSIKASSFEPKFTEAADDSKKKADKEDKAATAEKVDETPVEDAAETKDSEVAEAEVKEEAKAEEPAEDIKEEAKAEEPAEDTKEEAKAEEPAEDTKEEAKAEESAEDTK